MKEVLNVTITEYVELFLKKDRFAVVVLGTKSCVHVKKISETLLKIVDISTDIKFYFIITHDENEKEIEAMKKKFGVDKYPAVIVYKSGEHTGYVVSDMDEMAIEEFFRGVLG